MELAQYVNKVGELVNQSTKCNVELDKVSITNLVLLLHLGKLSSWASTKVDDEDKIIECMHCLKKQINFYPEKDIDDDCILTEVEEHIIQE